MGEYVFGQRWREVTVGCDVPGRGTQTAGGYRLRTGTTRSTAPVVWFGGPLQVRPRLTTGVWHCPVSYDEDISPDMPYAEKATWRAGEPATVFVCVETPVRDGGAAVILDEAHIPAVVHPRAVVTFRHRDPAKPPIVIEVELNGRCCGYQMYGDLTVPAEAAVGPATVEVSLAAWWEARVSPGVDTVEVVGWQGR